LLRVLLHTPELLRIQNVADFGLDKQSRMLFAQLLLVIVGCLSFLLVTWQPLLLLLQLLPPLPLTFQLLPLLPPLLLPRLLL
jgi:hypothetical protein